jgi:hypothetical protein
VTKFRHIPAAGRAIIVLVTVGVFAVVAVSCAASYNAIYHLVDSLDLYGTWMTKLFPGLVDVAFLIGETAAILGGIMLAVTRSDEVTRGWPWTVTLLCGAATLAFNEAHAYLIGGRSDPMTVWRCLVAALPPLLMMVSFQVLIHIVKWVMLHLGRPLNSAAVLSPTGMVPVYGPTAPHRAVPGLQTDTWTQPGLGQDGYSGQGGNGGSVSKRQQVEAYLAALEDEQRTRLAAIGTSAAAREVAGALGAQGHPVDERYTARILNDLMPARRGRAPRRRR